jgi:lipoyl(octanoyl) transferase
MLLTVHHLGITEYSHAFYLQRRLLHLILEGKISDTLLLLEHPPTITIGKFGRFENVLASHEQLDAAGISLFFTDRGGNVTYHGLGQLVVYPIINLGQRDMGIRQYIYALEEVIIRLLGSFSIAAGRRNGHVGVWVKDEAVAAIGLNVKHWVTMHGFAINVNNNLNHFSLIKPCGYSDRKVTSISKLLERHVQIDEVIIKLLEYFSVVFEIDIEIRSDLDLVRCSS